MVATDQTYLLMPANRVKTHPLYNQISYGSIQNESRSFARDAGHAGPQILLRGHLHGYAIAQLIQQLSDDLLRVEEGSLYPALQRLELMAGSKVSGACRLITGALASTDSLPRP